ncbi:E3 ubiquitin-protein ligase parkin-like [Dreissena polymorpha]|uniref:E3 ubiquitin-protein ligase parkin-like n=1 Tax=Dreissena polymorpha TaxID=45954 RepID=UPI002264748C|nr:E3 ubiquitin-protein ligase parkin-like [Dreissena polymorpha]XP_052243018.1 E3 ubiquitin-protein ligase parkin-like [Dreissena polymorpha]
MTVNVRFPKNIQRVIDIGDAASVEDVKEAISKNSKLDPWLFDLLFCGKVLNSDQQIKSLNLGAGSVLHVIEIKHKTVQPDLSLETKSETSDSKRYNYYVYCKQCKDLQAGKLRVRCHTCRQGAIILSKEPGGWSDVLRPRQLEGFCKDCDGNQPAQFYFKCCNHDGKEDCLPLRHVRPNTQGVKCVICTEISGHCCLL